MWKIRKGQASGQGKAGKESHETCTREHYRYHYLHCTVKIDEATSVLDCRFRDSVLHGRARRIDMKKFREFRRQLTFVGRYTKGRPSGPCWSYREGGGFLFGVPDQTGTLTGAEIAYIYPGGNAIKMSWLKF